jgi:septum formation protein
MKLILASTSSYRKSLLGKLAIPFTAMAPKVDETPFPHESAQELVKRLAIAKARIIGEQHLNAFVIGSDQVACLNGNILGKPGNHQNAFAQLSAASGLTVSFYTGLCLYNAAQQDYHYLLEPFEVEFKTLTAKQIETYLQLEKPYDCAGSFKSEGAGICLFSALRGRDPNALIGLPLIGLGELFSAFGIDIFDFMQLQQMN